jgi:hypothetical protein
MKLLTLQISMKLTLAGEIQGRSLNYSLIRNIIKGAMLLKPESVIPMR